MASAPTLDAGAQGSTPQHPVLSPVTRFPPEIWSAVFEHLDEETPTLAAAARVCRAWLAPAATVLWRDPLPRALDACVAASARARDIYAPAVRFLAIDDATTPDVLGRWRFPGARALHYGNRRAWWALDARLAALALERCGPRLTRARIGTFDDGWLQCEEEMASHASPVAHLESCIGYDALALFAQRPRLCHFVADSHLTHGALQRCRRHVARPFADLERMEVSLRAPDVPAYVALMQHAPLAVLRLHVLWDGPFIGVLARLRHLRKLSLM
jgi:hypothetical protein